MCDAHPMWLAHSRMQRRRYDDAMQLASASLQDNRLDQAAWYVKCRAITLKAWADDTQHGRHKTSMADTLTGEHSMAQSARPGTSLKRPATGGMRPGAEGRPGTGSVGTAAHGSAGCRDTPAGTCRPITAALKAGRPGTGAAASRPLTSAGARHVRLGTASMASAGAGGGPFIHTERLNLRKYAARPALARVLCDYIAHVDGNACRMMELAEHAVAAGGGAAACDAATGGDWWWHERLGKAAYQLGLMRDAAKQFDSAAQQQDMPVLAHQQAQVCLAIDQPLAALELYAAAAQRHPADTSLLLAQARIQEALGQHAHSLALHQQVLALDASCVEAIGYLAADHFHSDQAEVAIRYYRRLLQMGEAGSDVWANLGVACFAAGQHDICLSCFQRALDLAGDCTLPDIWHNIAQVALGFGQSSWAEQCFRVAIAHSQDHPQALNDLDVLQTRRRRL